MDIKVRTFGMLSFFLIGVILFDAWQQYYYLSNFNILKDDESVSLWGLIQSHSFKWMVWLVFIMPFVFIMNKLDLWKSIRSVSGMVQTVLIMIGVIILAVGAISMINSIQEEGVLVWNQWVKVAKFTFFQKFATFMLGYLLVYYYMYHTRELNQMEGKISTIREVKNSYRDLYEDLKEQSIQEETSVLYVKIGNKIKVVPVTGIEWIQSDDYCVRVHADDHEYVLRKSMKAMEEMLPENFLRVHRQAIINTDFIKELVFNGRNVIILKDGTQVAIAKSRLSEVRKTIKTL